MKTPTFQIYHQPEGKAGDWLRGSKAPGFRLAVYMADPDSSYSHTNALEVLGETRPDGTTRIVLREISEIGTTVRELTWKEVTP